MNWYYWLQILKGDLKFVIISLNYLQSIRLLLQPKDQMHPFIPGQTELLQLKAGAFKVTGVSFLSRLVSVEQVHLPKAIEQRHLCLLQGMTKTGVCVVRQSCGLAAGLHMLLDARRQRLTWLDQLEDQLKIAAQVNAQHDGAAA